MKPKTIPGATIFRRQSVPGLVTPAIIHNSNYFFGNLAVFADGLVDCSEMLDLKLFQQKLDEGWVITSVPDGADIDIHALGCWTVEDGKWDLDARKLYRRVEGLVRKLNPRMENLHDCHGRTTLKVGKARHSILGFANDKPARQEEFDPLLKRPIKGENVSVFVRHKPSRLKKEKTYLADLRVFPDGVIELGRLPGTAVFRSGPHRRERLW